MKHVIVLRHGKRDGDDLSKEGITEAQQLSTTIGSFSVVVSSPKSRAVHSAEILAQTTKVTVDERADIPTFSESDVHRLERTQKTHPLGVIGAIWEDEKARTILETSSQRPLELIQEIFEQLKADERALVVTHDGTMIGLEKLLTDGDFAIKPDHSYAPLSGFVVTEDMSTRPFTP